MTTRLLRGLALGALAVLAGCTDPTAIGPEPQFVGIGNISSFDGFDGPGQLVGLPPDSCPTLPTTQGVRLPLIDEPATLALPADLVRSTARFGATPGIVFNAPNTGFIAVSYDVQQPILYTRSVLDVRNPRSVYVNFTRTCRVTVGGRPAQLLLSFDILGSPTPTGILYGRAMMLRATSPTGRRVNMLIALHELGNLDPAAWNSDLLRLVSVAATLQW